MMFYMIIFKKSKIYLKKRDKNPIRSKVTFVKLYFEVLTVIIPQLILILNKENVIFESICLLEYFRYLTYLKRVNC